MLDIIIIIFFGVMAFQVAKAVKREKEIFIEFNQSTLIGWFSLLFPLGPIVYLTTVYRLGWAPAIILMILCYLPALIASKKIISALETAGTDRVNNAKNAATKSFGTSIAGLLYAGIILSMIFVNNVMA